MTATTSGGAPAGATASPSAPSVAFAGRRRDGLRAPVFCRPEASCPTWPRSVAASSRVTTPLIGSLDLRSQLRTRLLRPRAELTVDRGLDPGLRQEVLKDANVGPAHSLAQVPFSECDAASICRGNRQHEYS